MEEGLGAAVMAVGVVLETARRGTRRASLKVPPTTTALEALGTDLPTPNWGSSITSVALTHTTWTPTATDLDASLLDKACDT